MTDVSCGGIVAPQLKKGFGVEELGGGVPYNLAYQKRFLVNYEVEGMRNLVSYARGVLTHGDLLCVGYG